MLAMPMLNNLLHLHLTLRCFRCKTYFDMHLNKISFPFSCPFPIYITFSHLKFLNDKDLYRNCVYLLSVCVIHTLPVGFPQILTLPP